VSEWARSIRRQIPPAAVALWFVWLLCAAPFFAKHTAPPAFGVLSYGAALLAWMWVVAADPPWLRAARHPVFIATAILALGIASVILHPTTRAVSPSTAPEALMATSERLLAGRYPYDSALSDGAPISPGAAWAVLYAPLSLGGAIAAASSVALGLLYLAIRRLDHGAAAGLVLLLFSCIPFLQASVVGHDLFVIGIAMAILAACGPTPHTGRLASAAYVVLLAVVASARVPLIVLPAMLAAFVLRHRPVFIATIATLLALAVHLVMAGLGARLDFSYQPMHVLGRASSGIPGWLSAAAAVGWMVYAAGLRRFWRPELSVQLALLWLALAPPFAVVGLMELVKAGVGTREAWAYWEGKNYVAFLTPLLAVSLAVAGRSRGGGPGRRGRLPAPRERPPEPRAQNDESREM